MTAESFKVLICDDSILSRKQIKDVLTGLGCGHIEQAPDGITAVEKYKEFHPDLVLMDIVMPKKDGLDALKDILAYDSKAYVVMASSVGSKEHLTMAIQAGARDFIQKPIKQEQLAHIFNIAIGGGI